eukprot:1351936-Rhodomonas_salina.1
MKHCLCPNATLSSPLCLCADPLQTPVGPGSWAPDRVVFDANSQGQCACVCQSAGCDGWRELGGLEGAADVMAVRGKGGVQGDAAGTAVAFVDMNRDGFADMVVGASRFDSNRGYAQPVCLRDRRPDQIRCAKKKRRRKRRERDQARRVCVVFGKGGLAGQQASTLDVLSGANGFCLEGATSGDRLGLSCARL